MFDLFRSRDKVVRYLLGGLLVIVALSMVTYLVPNYTDATTTGTNPVLAEIDGQKIYAADVEQMFQASVAQSGQVPAEVLQTYFPQYAENVIQQRAAVYQAKRMGLKVTDEEVRVYMASAYSQFFPNGTLENADAFRQALAQQGVTPAMVLDDAYNNQLLRKLRNSIIENTIVTPKEVEREYRNKQEKASVRYIGVSSSDFRGKVSVTDQELHDRFDKTKALYTQPEKYSFRVVVLDQAKVEQGVQITEQELRNLYASAQDNFRIPERAHVRHILLITQDKTDAEKEALKKKADDLLAQIKKGADFATLAKENSDDPGTAANGGEMDPFGPGQLSDAAFENAAFALKPGETSNVITTAVGYDIIQLIDKESARLTPFEEVRPQLEDEVRARKAVEQVDTVSRNMHADLVANPANAAEIAKKYGGELVAVKDVAPGEPIPTLGVTPEIEGALAGLQPGGVTDVVAIPGNRLVAAVLDERIPSRPSTFEEAEAQVRDSLLNEKEQQLATETIQKAADRIKAREDMAAVAKSMGLTVTTSSNFTRTDTIEGLGPAAYLEEAFTAPLGTIVGPREIQGRTVVAEITDRQEADMSNFIFERDKLLQDMKTQRAAERDQLWQDSLLTKLIDEGKVKIYQDQIQAATTAFAQ